MASANASIDSISKLLVGSSYRDGETGRDREGETKRENLHNQEVFRMIKLLRI